ncbi:FLYWCH domain containing protein, partial [Asbolus verrucosus]
VIHFIRGHKYPKLILHNNEFIVHQKGSSRTRWRCAQCNKTKCKAALFTTGKVVHSYYEHNHAPTMENRSFESLFCQNMIKKVFFQMLFTSLKVSNIIHFIKGCKYPYMIIDDNKYIVHHRLKQSTRWRCVMFKKTGCGSVLSSFQRKVYVYSEHNHEPTMKNQSLKDACKQWRCSFCTKYKCKSRLYSYGRVIQSISNHNHGPVLKTQDLSKFSGQLVTIIRK